MRSDEQLELPASSCCNWRSNVLSISKSSKILPLGSPAAPENWLLAGGVDTAAALIAEPGLLLRRKGYAPMLWTAGLETREGEGHYFEAYGYDMTFNRRMHFGECAETSSCGLVVIEP